jgi:hypothetical protein
MKQEFKVGDKVRVAKRHWTFNVLGKMDKWIGHVMTIREIGFTAAEMEEDKNENDARGWDWNYECLEPVESEQITINRYGNKVVAKMGKETGVARCNETDTFDFYTGVKIAVDRLLGKESEVKEVREVKRRAKVGEYIKITNSIITGGQYKNGDVLKVKYSNEEAFYGKESVCVEEFKLPILTSEYVVLENYKPHKKPQEEKPKYYNGKVVCVKSKDISLTVGKIYVFKDGLSKWDNGELLPQSENRKPFESFEDLQSWIVSDSKFIELVEDK